MINDEFVLIENWAIVCDTEDPYKAPELTSAKLRGDIYGHSRHQNGKHILTSTIQEVDLENERILTRNTVYHLGNPSEEWIAWMKAQTHIDPKYIKLVERCRIVKT